MGQAQGPVPTHMVVEILFKVQDSKREEGRNQRISLFLRLGPSPLSSNQELLFPIHRDGKLQRKFDAKRQNQLPLPDNFYPRTGITSVNVGLSTIQMML